MADIILKKSDLVLSGTNSLVEYTPDNNEEILVYQFNGSAPGSSKSQVVLLWDGVKKWAIQNDQPMPDGNWFQVTGDGTKKLTLCLSNGCSGDYVMSGLVKMESI